MNEPQVSIIIPTYNGERFLAETIDSCLNQIYSKVEIVIVDDCSTDGTAKVLELYRNHEKITLLQNLENLGITASCNRGWRASRGDFLIFLGHDDLLPPQHVEKIVAEFEPETAFVHCNSQVIDQEGRFLRHGCDDSIQKLKNRRPLHALSKGCFIQSCGLMIRRTHFERIGGWDERFRNYGEWLYYIRLLQGGSAKYSTASYGLYRRHQTNITRTFGKRKNMWPLLRYQNTCRLAAFLAAEKNVWQAVRFIFLFSRKNFSFVLHRYLRSA